jgi:hypothetical protein
VTARVTAGTFDGDGGRRLTPRASFGGAFQRPAVSKLPAFFRPTAPLEEGTSPPLPSLHPLAVALRLEGSRRTSLSRCTVQVPCGRLLC